MLAAKRSLIALVGSAALVAGVLPAYVAGAGLGASTVVARVHPLDEADRARMTGVSWRPGCPVGLGQLRVVQVVYRSFEGRRRAGRIIVHRDVAPAVARIFDRLLDSGVRVRRVVPIDAYGGDDFASIEADNTSGFNCRYVGGTRRWSEHAYGRAIDINPIENPFVDGDHVAHRASRPYRNRSDVKPGMAVEGGPLVRVFSSEGWSWGGRWVGAVRDYQHFSTSGR